jgi:hypothetical protein
MGACNFTCYGHGKDVKDAYHNAVDDARYEHGHDPYNGTISTTSVCEDVTEEYPRYGTKAFRLAIDKVWDTVPKWECRAVEVTGKALKEYRKRNGLERKRIRVFFFFGIAGS